MMRDVDRMEIAQKLRFNAGTSLHMNTSDDFAREVFRATMDEVIGDYQDAINRLADLIDATCEAHRDVILYPATDLTPEHEEIVYRCDECGEIVSFDEDYDPKTDLPAYCLRCGSRITGIGEPWQG